MAAWPHLHSSQPSFGHGAFVLGTMGVLTGAVPLTVGAIALSAFDRQRSNGSGTNPIAMVGLTQGQNEAGFLAALGALVLLFLARPHKRY